jgi:hypothetical protein
VYNGVRIRVAEQSNALEIVGVRDTPIHWAEFSWLFDGMRQQFEYLDRGQVFVTSLSNLSAPCLENLFGLANRINPSGRMEVCNITDIELYETVQRFSANIPAFRSSSNDSRAWSPNSGYAAFDKKVAKNGS